MPKQSLGEDKMSQSALLMKECYSTSKNSQMRENGRKSNYTLGTDKPVIQSQSSLTYQVAAENNNTYSLNTADAAKNLRSTSFKLGFKNLDYLTTNKEIYSSERSRMTFKTIQQ